MDEAMVERLRREGYEPLDDHTGVTEDLGPLWPHEHRVPVSDTEPGVHDDGTSWFVRSPWPSLTLDDIFLRLLWTWVEREPFEVSLWSARVVEVFGWSESQALEWMNKQS